MGNWVLGDLGFGFPGFFGVLVLGWKHCVWHLLCSRNRGRIELAVRNVAGTVA